MARHIVTNEYINKDTYTVIKINNQKYGDFEVLIDNDDVGRCKNHIWYINKHYKETEKDYFYAISNTRILLHRFIMNISDREQKVDHIEGNTLDNRKEKLQICSNKENSRKSEFRRNNKSGHTGVIWHNQSNKWMAYIKVDYKFKNLGYFDDKEDAIEARRKAEIKYFGDFKPISNCVENAINR